MSMPEPRFTLRAQDVLALDTVTAYRDLCLAHGLTAQADQVQLAIDEFAAWQEAHPDRVKMPDHQHMPADL